MFMIRKTIESEIRPACNLGRPPSACVSALAGLFLGDLQMKTIPLTQGKVAIVDDEDYEWLNQRKWYAKKGVSTWYAMRNEYSKNGHKSIRMHQQILTPEIGMEVDHIDHNGLNNQRNNIRIATNAENRHNQKLQKRTISGFKGVTWHVGDSKWRARITIDKQEKFLGNFNSQTNAAIAYDNAAKRLFGEFACLNFTREETDNG